MNTTVDQYILNKAQSWLEGNYDEDTKKQVKLLMDSNPDELIDSFYRELEFGTGGLRGVMGAGTNRMNKYTVGMATQGLANYLKKVFTGKETIKVAIAYDSRNNSSLFARIAAEVLSGNAIKVYLFDNLRPTPELSFSIRYLNCHAGIVITASHNPKEYNGYKVYWQDGGQLVPPHDKNIIAEVQKITRIDEVKFSGNNSLIEMIGEEIDKQYIQRIKALSFAKDIIERQKNLKIVYTALHGTGVNLVPQCLKEYGFRNIYTVPEQDVSDGNFPTVKSPNPEEPAALNLAIQKAKQIDADLVMGTDPDADRVGIAVKNNNKEFALLNGNQIASLLIYYLLDKWKENKKLTGTQFIVKTIVTTELIKDIADKYNVDCYDVLTGFKYIAEKINEHEGRKTFIGGGEESFGYLVSDFVRDKDAVISCCMIAEVVAWATDKGRTLFDLLMDIYAEFGFYKEHLLSVSKKGKEGAEEIQHMMDNYRSNPMPVINSSKVVMIKDYLLLKEKDINTSIEKTINLPKSNVIQFFLEDGSKITMRPSGTEPKIKFYFSVRTGFSDKTKFDETNQLLDKKIQQIITSMKLA